jgi:hypothetical protein
LREKTSLPILLWIVGRIKINSRWILDESI